MSENRHNVQVPIPSGPFPVEEGLPDLPTTGRSGQSKYAKLMEQARALKPNTKMKIPVDSALQRATVRNIRVAIKRFAPNLGLKVTTEGDDKVLVYRELV